MYVRMCVCTCVSVCIWIWILQICIVFRRRSSDQVCFEAVTSQSFSNSRCVCEPKSILARISGSHHLRLRFSGSSCAMVYRGIALIIGDELFSLLSPTTLAAEILPASSSLHFWHCPRLGKNTPEVSETNSWTHRRVKLCFQNACTLHTCFKNAILFVTIVNRYVTIVNRYRYMVNKPFIKEFMFRAFDQVWKIYASRMQLLTPMN